MPKAEGYTYTSSKKNIYYSKMFASGNNSILTDYKVKGEWIRGDKLIDSFMVAACPVSYPKYYAGSSSSNGFSNLAKEGTAVLGGNPTVQYTRDDNSDSEKITLKLSNSILSVRNGNNKQVASFAYTSGIDFIKIWIAATGAGGGGGGIGGSGGGGGGFAVFPAIIEEGGSIVITAGVSGHGGDDHVDPVYWGHNGGDTKVAYIKNNTRTLIGVIQGGWGGYGQLARNYDVGGGGVYLYGGIAKRVDNDITPTLVTEVQQTHLPTGWANLLNSSQAVLETSIESKHIYTDVSYSSNGLFACSGRNGAMRGGHPGGSFTATQIEPKQVDYLYPYSKNTWETSGGARVYTVVISNGGGASAFYESHGGDGGTASSAGGKNGYLGGGGGSGATGGSAGGGWGGFGAADIWIAGVTSGTVVSIGTRDSTSGGGEVTDNYPSGKDVTDEVTVTFKNGSGTAGDQVNIATFSSATIPSNKSVN